jgi:hypothetical protein
MKERVVAEAEQTAPTMVTTAMAAEVARAEMVTGMKVAKAEMRAETMVTRVGKEKVAVAGHAERTVIVAKLA